MLITFLSKIKTKYPALMLMGGISFFTDVASEMLYPITPIFLTTVIGSSMASVGLIEGIAEAVTSLLKVHSGFWSDRLNKRKPFIIVGYLISSLSRPLTGAATAIHHVFWARTVDRLGKGLRGAPRDALIADLVDSEDRGLAFGFHRFFDTMGAVIGPLIGILLITVVKDLRNVFYWAFIPGLFSVILVFFLKEKKIVRSSQMEKSKFRWKDFSPEFKLFLLSWGIFSLTNSSDAFLILKMRDTGLSLTTILLTYALYNLVYAISSPYLGDLSDRYHKKRVLLGGLCVFVIVYIGFALSTNLANYIFLFAFYGVYMAATEGVSKAYASQLVPNDRRGSGLGLLGTVVGLSQVIASLTTGLIWDHFGSTAALLFSSLGGITFILLNIFHHPRK